MCVCVFIQLPSLGVLNKSNWKPNSEDAHTKKLKNMFFPPSYANKSDKVNSPASFDLNNRSKMNSLLYSSFVNLFELKKSQLNE